MPASVNVDRRDALIQYSRFSVSGEKVDDIPVRWVYVF